MIRPLIEDPSPIAYFQLFCVLSAAGLAVISIAATVAFATLPGRRKDIPVLVVLFGIGAGAAWFIASTFGVRMAARMVEFGSPFVLLVWILAAAAWVGIGVSIWNGTIPDRPPATSRPH